MTAIQGLKVKHIHGSDSESFEGQINVALATILDDGYIIADILYQDHSDGYGALVVYEIPGDEGAE